MSFTAFLIILSISYTSALHKILPSDGTAAAYDRFGSAVDIADSFAIIGAVGNDDHRGSAYIFEPNPSSNNWTETQQLKPSDLDISDLFGYAVSITGTSENGGYAIIGARLDDAAYIFERDSSGDWTETAKLTASNNQSYADFGESVGITAAGYAIVGAPSHDNEGAVYIFERKDDGQWTEQKILTPSQGASSSMFFGGSVSMSGTYAIVGSAYADKPGLSNNGAAFIYEFDDQNGWIEKNMLFAPDPANDDYFGWSVGIAGGFAIISARRDDVSFTDTGSAYIYERGTTDWVYKQNITATDKEAYDGFGYSVAINSAGYCIVGASGEDSKGDDAGAAYIFHRDSTNGVWSQKRKITASDGASYDYFGEEVSISQQQIVIIGAPYDADNGYNSGSAYIGLAKECDVLDCNVNKCLEDKCDALTGCSDVSKCSEGEICLDPSVGECTQNCDSFDIDPFLTQCSANFNGSTADINQLKSDIVTINGELDGHDIDIASINAAVAAVNHRVDFIFTHFKKKKKKKKHGYISDSSEASSISIPSSSSSLFSSYKDELIVFLLITNILMIITCFCVFYKIKSNKYHKIAMHPSPDEENKRLKN